MLISAKSLPGFELEAADGRIGFVKDIYFDDQTWAVRFFVVATTHRRFCAEVLIAPDKIRGLDEAAQVLKVSLSRYEVENSPASCTAKPVCKQYEDQAGSSGWAIHRGRGALHRSDPHLRSMNALIGYQLHTRQQEIGQISDFLVDQNSWEFSYMVGSSGTWLHNPTFLLRTNLVESISWVGSRVVVNMSKDPELECLQEYLEIGA